MRALLVLVLLGSTALADNSNYKPYVVGSRAAGLGGAYTALAADGSGPYYNPGGLAFVKRTQLSLSASVYGLVSGTFKDTFGAGFDANYRDVNVFPVSTAAVFKLRDNTIALCVFVPDAFKLDDRETVGGPENAFYVHQEIQTVWVGPTYARHLGRLGVGASAYLLIGSESINVDFTQLVGPGGAFGTSTGRTNITNFGVVAAVGARYDVTDRFSVGAGLFTPEWGGGFRQEFRRSSGPLGGTVVNVDGLHATPSLPWRLQLGAALHPRRATIAADLTFLAPRDVLDDAGHVADGLLRHVERDAAVNVSVGGEYRVKDRVPLRAGFFTDFAQSPAPRGALTRDSAISTSHIDRVGFTASLGIKSEHTATDAGLMATYGWGTQLLPGGADFSSHVARAASEVHLYVFLASSYEF